MKILITNTVMLNGGDAAILLAMLDLLRLAFGENVTFIVYDQQPEIASQYYPNITFRKQLYNRIITRSSRIKYLKSKLEYADRIRFYFAAWCWSHYLRPVARAFLAKEELQDFAEYGSADLIVSTGGTYLVENYLFTPRIFDYKISLLMQRPLVFFTQSLGPFLNQNNRKKISKIFNSALLILLRDEVSLKHLQDLNINRCKLQVSSDAAFALVEEKTIKNASEQSLPKSSCLKIAISVRYWRCFKNLTTADGMKNFQDALRAVTEYMVQKFTAEITYISTCQGIPRYWTNDSEVAMQIIHPLDDNIQKHVNVDREFHNPKDLLELLKSYDLVIATRMHMAILALAAGTPVFPISYEFKTQELFNRLGLGQWVQDIETIEAKSLINSVELFLSTLPEIGQMLFTGVARERERALESSVVVKKAFEECQSLKK